MTASELDEDALVAPKQVLVGGFALACVAEVWDWCAPSPKRSVLLAPNAVAVTYRF